MKAREVLKRLRQEGWAHRPGKGSHQVFSLGERTVIVPSHAGDIPIGTLRNIFRQAGWPWPPK